MVTFSNPPTLWQICVAVLILLAPTAKAFIAPISFQWTPIFQQFFDHFLKNADNGMDADDETVAIGFRHSLGGGVSFRGGVGQNTSGDTVADLGLIFNF